MKRRWLFWVVAALAAIAAVVYFWLTPTIQQYMFENYSIERSSGGGFAGGGDGKNLHIANSTLTFSGGTKELSQQQVAEVKRLLQEADFFNLKDDYSEPRCADAYRIAIKVGTAGKQKTVSYDECGQKELPRSLLELDDYLTKLIDLN